MMMYEHRQLFDSMLERIREIGAENGLKPPQAFGRWFAGMYFDEPREFFYADGPGDAKIDLFFTTSDGREVRHHVLNTKFTETYNSTAPRSFYDEITAFWQAFKNKSNRANYLEKIARRDVRLYYSKLFEHYDDGRAHLYFLTNSKRNEAQIQAIKNYAVEVFHLDDVLQFMADYVENAMPRTRDLRLTGISNVLSADRDETEVPTSIVFARLTDFISYMKDDKYDLLFNRNVRVWLGNTEVNKAISDTFRAAPKEFAYSNNGITILCEGHTTHQGMCRIQTFPDGLSIQCGRTEMQRQLGNAVPSLMAEVLAREIRAQLLDRPIRTPLKLLPPRRDPVPAPEKLTRLPSKYRKYIGKHQAHPGEGKGRLARQRAEERTLPEAAE
jgi:site-specific DNA-cytosine methylase